MEEHDDQEERRRYRSVPNSLSCDPINRTKSQPGHVRDWHPSDALIKTERVGSLVLSGRAYKGREPTRLILGRDRRAVTD